MRGEPVGDRREERRDRPQAVARLRRARLVDGESEREGDDGGDEPADLAAIGPDRAHGDAGARRRPGAVEVAHQVAEVGGRVALGEIEAAQPRFHRAAIGADERVDARARRLVEQRVGQARAFGLDVVARRAFALEPSQARHCARRRRRRRATDRRRRWRPRRPARRNRRRRGRARARRRPPKRWRRRDRPTRPPRRSTPPRPSTGRVSRRSGRRRREPLDILTQRRSAKLAPEPEGPTNPIRNGVCASAASAISASGCVGLQQQPLNRRPAVDRRRPAVRRAGRAARVRSRPQAARLRPAEPGRRAARGSAPAPRSGKSRASRSSTLLSLTFILRRLAAVRAP